MRHTAFDSLTQLHAGVPIRFEAKLLLALHDAIATGQHRGAARNPNPGHTDQQTDYEGYDAQHVERPAAVGQEVFLSCLHIVGRRRQLNGRETRRNVSLELGLLTRQRIGIFLDIHNACCFID